MLLAFLASQCCVKLWVFHSSSCLRNDESVMKKLCDDWQATITTLGTEIHSMDRESFVLALTGWHKGWQAISHVFFLFISAVSVMSD